MKSVHQLLGLQTVGHEPALPDSSLAIKLDLGLVVGFVLNCLKAQLYSLLWILSDQLTCAAKLLGCPLQRGLHDKVRELKICLILRLPGLWEY